MVELAIPEDPAEFDRALESLPNRQAVFLLWPREGKPYLARTNVLRKRLTRLLGPRSEAPSRSLNLRGTIERIEYQFTGSRLAAQFLVLELAQEIPRGRLSQRDSPATAALREADSLQPVPTHASDNSHRARAGRILRSLPQSVDSGAVRVGVSGPVPAAPVSGGSGTTSRPSGLHLRRDGTLPSALPAGRGRCGISR